MKNTRFVHEQLLRIGRALEAQKNAPRLLEAIAWPREVEEKFFAAGADCLPEISYAIDRSRIERHIGKLAGLERSIEGDDAIAAWLRTTVESAIRSSRLVLAAGTRDFYRQSLDLYGGARSPFFGGRMRNIDLADHLLNRLRVHGWDEACDANAPAIGARKLKTMFETQIARRRPRMKIEVVIDKGATAKVVAAMSRVRIRPDATFSPWEAEGLFHHEIETHALTAHNGAQQKHTPFLRSGGPRTTRTQEGLAMFAELYSRTLSVERLERLAVRVKLVDMAEQGASFLDLYRFLIDRGSPRRDAYYDAQRICRGGVPSGGAPFTKDACYLAGLLEVYTFLSAVVRGGFRDEMELLVCGRIHLDDIAVLAELRAIGLLSRPRFLPSWLVQWQALLPYFAFTSFMDGIDIRPVEAHYGELIRVAEAAGPRRG
jgi:uncharacterized protein (TIGR02421 family)